MYMDEQGKIIPCFIYVGGSEHSIENMGDEEIENGIAQKKLANDR